jgi:hypothetical protein
VCDDPPGDSVGVPSLDQSGLDAAGLEDAAGLADAGMVEPDEADLDAEAAVEGVVVDDLGDLADVDGVEVDVDLEEEDKDGTRAVAGDLGDALTAGPLAAAGIPGVSAPGEEPAPAAGGGAAAAEQAGVAGAGAAEG